MTIVQLGKQLQKETRNDFKAWIKLSVYEQQILRTYETLVTVDERFNKVFEES